MGVSLGLVGYQTTVGGEHPPHVNTTETNRPNGRARWKQHLDLNLAAPGSAFFPGRFDYTPKCRALGECPEHFPASLDSMGGQGNPFVGGLAPRELRGVCGPCAAACCGPNGPLLAGPGSLAVIAPVLDIGLFSLPKHHWTLHRGLDLQKSLDLNMAWFESGLRAQDSCLSWIVLFILSDRQGAKCVADRRPFPCSISEMGALVCNGLLEVWDHSMVN